MDKHDSRRIAAAIEENFAAHFNHVAVERGWTADKGPGISVMNTPVTWNELDRLLTDIARQIAVVGT